MTQHQHRYVTIEGAIGVGKTTLARLLKEPLAAELLLEVFEENPFLSDFYADRQRYAFQTQIFFLLSRYRQQHSVIRQTLRQHNLISDYVFDKDRLFAELNLKGDEWCTYERVHAILSEHIPAPDLVVFLRADTDVLMQRIRLRDRAYERTMSRDYIDELRIAYERFFAQYTGAPVLTIDTNDLNIVQDPHATDQVVASVRQALEQPFIQERLPELDSSVPYRLPNRLSPGPRLSDVQIWQERLDGDTAPAADVNFHYLSLAQDVGMLGAELKAVWATQEALYEQVGNQLEARSRALEEHGDHLRAELTDCLCSLVRLANLAGIDLERAFVERTATGHRQR